jgi:hypothetical protein
LRIQTLWEEKYCWYNLVFAAVLVFCVIAARWVLGTGILVVYFSFRVAIAGVD